MEGKAYQLRTGRTNLVQYVWMHYLIIAITIPAVVLSLFRVDDPAITYINIFWALVNASLLMSFLIRGSEKVAAPATSSRQTLGEPHV